MKYVMVLNDGETYTDLEDCTIVARSNGPTEVDNHYLLRFVVQDDAGPGENPTIFAVRPDGTILFAHTPA